MREQIELGKGDCNFTIKSPHFCLGSSRHGALGRGDALGQVPAADCPRRSGRLLTVFNSQTMSIWRQAYRS